MKGNTDVNNKALKKRTKRRQCVLFKKNKTPKQKMLLGFAVIAALLLVLGLLTLILGAADSIIKKANDPDRTNELINDRTKDDHGHVFFEHEAGYNVLEDEAYLDKRLDIMYYDDRGNGYLITDGKYLERGGLGLELMSYYFDAVKNGKSELLNTMLSPSFIRKNGKYGEFYCQGIYDINIELSSVEVDEDNMIRTYVYVVGYKIFKNDGSFRTDIGSDTTRRQYFVLKEDYSGELEADELPIVIDNITDVKKLYG